MGRNAYLYLLSLGRQCYEPQHHAPLLIDISSTSSTSPNTTAQSQNQASATPQNANSNSGAPAAPAARVPASSSSAVVPARPAQTSIDLQRSLRKAQNDVLNTIGLQLHKGGSRREKSRAERSALQEKEDDMGLLLGGIDLACMYFFTWPLIGIRNELQAFRALDHISYTDLIRLIAKNRTILDCFAGVSAHIVYQLVNVLREYLQSLLFKWLKRQPIFRDSKTRKPNRRVLNLLYKGNLPRTDKFEKAELSAGFVVGEAEYDEFLSLSDDEGEVGELGVGEGDEELAAVMTGRRGGGGMVDGINGVMEGNGLMGTPGEWMPFPVDESAGVGIDPVAGPSRRGGRRRGSSNAIETQTFTATITPDTPVLERHPDNGSNGGMNLDDSGGECGNVGVEWCWSTWDTSAPWWNREEDGKYAHDFWDLGNGK
ncbi:hypothetical protein AA313_de0201378 [Arthrobotrys entomopaga]|nr:hypothetical protein AA313_de0201378 [Arthrobotrys entomopaga]